MGITYSPVEWNRLPLHARFVNAPITMACGISTIAQSPWSTPQYPEYNNWIVECLYCKSSRSINDKECSGCGARGIK